MVSSMMEGLGFLQRLDHPSTKWRRMLLLLFLTGWTKVVVIHGEFYDEEGPTFTQEPSRYNYFTNIQGLAVHCKAKGTPAPEVHWINQKDNQLVSNYSGVREVFPNGTLVFQPFPVSYYRPDIHDQVYVCLASNSVGKVRSRDALVRAVISQRYDVRVEDVYVSEGNDALIKCIIPDNIREFVSVTSWTKDGSLNIFPHSGSGGKYFMTPSGELLIEEVNRNDSASTFRCRTVNRLTGETQLSENSARLQLSGGSSSKSDSPPSITSRGSKLTLKEGEVAVLLCLSQGSPPPTHWWFRGKGGYEGLERVRQTERIRVRKNAVIIENVGVKDSGSYTCYVNSTSGSDRHQIDLLVTSPLIVQVVPSVLTVDIGKSAEFTCWTNTPDDSFFLGSPAFPSTSRQITWRKDGNEIRSNSKLSIDPSGEVLRILSIQREDKGLYQCFVRSDSDMVQASAELRLGDAAPQLVYRFIEQTLRPGPPVSLKCSAVGNPTPHFSWFLDSFPLPHSERLLIGQYVTLNGDVVSHVNITGTRLEDGGEFKCVANNKLGSTAHSARLNIYGPPFVRNMPSPITAVAGKDFKIKCPVAGYPIQSITWEKDGQTLPMTMRQLLSPDGTLTVKGVDRIIDAGKYACIATNKQGHSDRKETQLHVVVPPKIVQINFPNGTKEGDRILVTCGVSEGTEPIRLKWLKNKEVLGDTLQVDKAGSSAQGKDPRERFPSDPTSGISISPYFEALALRIEHVKSRDAGNYTCLAQNSAGEFLSTAQLVVHVPPRIAPFSFPSQVSEGSRVQAVCSVEHQADLEETNLTVTWLKDSQPLQMSLPMSRSSAGGIMSSNFAKVVHVDAYSAMLIIERVDSAHNGNYTCKISNSVEEVSSSASLVVRVPPKWILEPKETEVTEGSPVVIPCQADGFPTPSLSWKKATGSRPEHYRDIALHSGGDKSVHHGLSYGSLMVGTSAFPEDTFSLMNGSLVIRSAKKVHQGFYLCEASNGIGTGLSKVIRLLVNVPVHIKDPIQNVTTRVGSKAILRCEISGDPPILEIGWKRGLTEIKPDSDSRYFIRLLNNSQGIFSEMTVSNVGREDTARYSCSAANQHGRSQAVVWLYVQEPPDVPRNLHVISKASRSVRLGWILTQDGNSPIIHFIIKYKEDSESPNNLRVMTVPGTIFSETVGNLRPNKMYMFSLSAENNVGQSESSEILEIKTDGEAPEGRPKNVRVVAVSSSEIQVTWEYPEKDTWHGDLLGYYVGYRRYREGEQYQFITVEWREGSQEYQIKKLRAFSSYEVVVQAYNGIGAGPLSESVVATTLIDVPSAPPEGLHCSPLTSHNLQLSWNPLTLEQARGLIKGYKVILERTDFDTSHSDEVPLIRNTPSTNLVVSGLGKYSNYSVVALAFTEAGDGPSSSEIFCHTEEDIPGSPSAIKSVVSSSSSITVSWLPPAEPNGVITNYNVYLSTALSGKAKDPLRRKRHVPPDVTKIQFDGLQVEEKYEFRVAASTRVGEGSQAVVQKVQGRNVQPAIVSFGNELYAVWKTDVRLLCDTVGNPSIQWFRYADLLKESDRLSFRHDGSVMIRNARRDDGGNYTCSISGNKGRVVDSILYKVTIQVPPKGPVLNVTTVSISALTLQWKLWDSGGAVIKGYVVHFRVFDKEWQERKISRYLNSYELKDLQCGTHYQMFITAYNRAGMGGESELINVSTLGSTPTFILSSPQYMIETSNSTSKILLKNVWSDNECKIQSFQVYYREQGSHYPWIEVNTELTGDSSSVELHGLKPGRNYDVRVNASSGAGFALTEASLIMMSPNKTFGTPDEVYTYSKDSTAFPFDLNMKWIIVILILSPTLLLSVLGACVCYWRKMSISGENSREQVTMGTPSSSTYLNYNQNQRNSQQMYMTVKKSTPLKDIKDIDTIPQYADDISPYATFELTETRRESKPNTSIPTLDRRRMSHNCNWNSAAEASYNNDMLRTTSRPKQLRGVNDAKDEIYEYDSSASDSEMDKDNLPKGVNKVFLHHKNTLMLGNRYELSPCAMNAMKYQEGINHIPLQNGIHGMIIADDYAFNCDVPPQLVDERMTGRRAKRTNRRKSQGQVGNPYASVASPAYGECNTSTSPRYGKFKNAKLDPPSGFEDPEESPGFINNEKRPAASKGNLSTANGNALINV